MSHTVTVKQLTLPPALQTEKKEKNTFFGGGGVRNPCNKSPPPSPPPPNPPLYYMLHTASETDTSSLKLFQTFNFKFLKVKLFESCANLDKPWETRLVKHQ